eukprot:997753-Prorocentrum_minimum.AAC.1
MTNRASQLEHIPHLQIVLVVVPPPEAAAETATENRKKVLEIQLEQHGDQPQLPEDVPGGGANQLRGKSIYLEGGQIN